MKLWTNADLDSVLRALDSAGRRRRHEIRYACFRMQAEASGGASAGDEHREIAKQIEVLPVFDGWENFASTWDVSTPDPIVLVPRKWSIHQEHDQTMRRITMSLPGTVDE